MLALVIVPVEAYSNRSLYSYVMDSFSIPKRHSENNSEIVITQKVVGSYEKKEYDVPTYKLKKELDDLYDEIKEVEYENLKYQSYLEIVEYAETQQSKLNLQYDMTIAELENEKELLENEMMSDIESISISDLSVLQNRHNKLCEEIEEVQRNKTNLTEVVSAYSVDEVDVKSMREKATKLKNEIADREVMSDPVIISQQVVQYSHDSLGKLSMLRRPYNYKTVITSWAGYRSDPMSGKTKYHKGMDYAMPTGTELFSLFNGVVTRSYNNGDGYGESIVIDCGRGIVIRYAHLSKRLVKVGDKISQNQLIGLSGNTGNSTGPHLHLELIINSKPFPAERLFT